MSPVAAATPNIRKIGIEATNAMVKNLLRLNLLFDMIGTRASHPFNGFE